MKPIGVIDTERLRHIPVQYRARHEFCFHLYDLMRGLLKQLQLAGVHGVSVDLAEGEIENLRQSSHVLDFLADSGRGEVERRAVVNHLTLALYSDMLNFVYEALCMLEKRKFVVAFALLRKPFKEGMLLAAQMCADETAFFAKFRSDAANLLNRNELDEAATKRVLSEAMAIVCPDPTILEAEVVYKVIFDRKVDSGLASLFDVATHLTTENRQIRTANYNLNLIFKNPSDNDVYSGGTYLQIAMVLLFLALMQIALCNRMTKIARPYRNWMLFTSLGTYEALFSSGNANITRFVRNSLGDLLECSWCGERMRVRKTDAPRFFIGERIECSACGLDQSFPFGWLLGKIELDLFGAG
ncbi:MAG: hypothetical protein AAF530_00680 [Pseudomonadota bacterium]